MQGIWDGIAHAEHAATEAEETTKRIMRILTVTERQHGLSAALTALLGQQPGSSWERVGDGLCEIIASAMLALSTITANPEQTLGRYLGTEAPAPRAKPLGQELVTALHNAEEEATRWVTDVVGNRHRRFFPCGCTAITEQGIPTACDKDSAKTHLPLQVSLLEDPDFCRKLVPFTAASAVSVMSLQSALGNPAVENPEVTATDGDSASR